MRHRKNQNLQHVQIPHNMCKNHELEPFDVLVYAMLKRFMNNKTRKAYPSMETLKTLTQSGHAKIAKSISKLLDKYLKVYKEGKRNVYVFSHKYTHFEPFSTDFLDMTDLSILEKSYVLVAQQYMFKDMAGFGKVSFTTKDLSQLINMSEVDIWKCERSLREKGYLTTVKSKDRDFNTGLSLTIRIFNMELLRQKVLWALIESVTKIRKHNDELVAMYKNLRDLQKVNAVKEKELSKYRNEGIFIS